MLYIQVFKVAYVDDFKIGDVPHVQAVCQEFVDAIRLHKPSWLQKPKIHLLLHLPQCMANFGPTSAFNTERYQTFFLMHDKWHLLFFKFRCESFNSIVRSYNVYSNHQAPSRDIAIRFGRVSYLLHLCSTDDSFTYVIIYV